MNLSSGPTNRGFWIENRSSGTFEGVSVPGNAEYTLPAETRKTRLPGATLSIYPEQTGPVTRLYQFARKSLLIPRAGTRLTDKLPTTPPDGYTRMRRRKFGRPAGRVARHQTLESREIRSRVHGYSSTEMARAEWMPSMSAILRTTSVSSGSSVRISVRALPC